MTNPHAAMRMLFTYVICIPLALLVGYLLTNPLDYSTLGFLGIVIALIISPIFIKWHYPIMVFSLFCPVICFFLIGKPPLWQVMVAISLTIAVTERIMNTDQRFLSVPALTWPFLFIGAVAFMTAELNGGIGLHTLGGEAGGGRKYITIFLGIAAYFALARRAIPPARRNLYVVLFFLPGLLALIGDLFPFLPAPLNYINLLIPPTGYLGGSEIGSTRLEITRYSALTNTAQTLIYFMLVKWGMRGIFLEGRFGRTLAFLLALMMIPLGGFRGVLINMIVLISVVMYLEKLRGFLVTFFFGSLVAIAMLVPFAGQLPLNYQRTMAFLPLNWNQEVVADADGSSEWRFQIWRLLWPKVPQYLLLGKGYAMTKEEFDLIANPALAGATAGFNADETPLAFSSDFHSGPLSTLIPMGLWGAIGIVWLMAACLWVHYRNFRYGPPELKTANALMLAWCIQRSITFFFIFGSFCDDIGFYAKLAGICVALNGGVLGPAPKSALHPRIKPAAVPEPA